MPRSTAATLQPYRHTNNNNNLFYLKAPFKNTQGHCTVDTLKTGNAKKKERKKVHD